MYKIKEICESYINGNHSHVFKEMLPQSNCDFIDFLECLIDDYGVTKSGITSIIRRAINAEYLNEVSSD